jgi:hypothetical protein
MKLDFAFFADSAVVSSSGIFSLLNAGIEWFQVKAFPAMLPNLALIARISFDANECGKSHVCTIHVTDPEGVALQPDLTIPVLTPGNPRHPGEGKTFVGRFGYDRFLFTKAGYYRFSLNLDGKVIGDATIEVYLESAS